MKNKHFKIRYLILLSVLLVLVTPIILWQTMARKNLEIVVLNKTFSITSSLNGDEVELDYSKQQGLFWIINYLGIKNPNTNKPYDVVNDYYGNFISKGKLTEKPLNKLTNVPDIIYLADTYGTGNSKINGVEAKGSSGLTEDEIGLISTCYAKGTTVIGEYNIAGEPTKANVAKELEDILGTQFTGWAGKFFMELSSTSDVPKWIRTIYEEQYGKKWSLSGTGIIIAGNSRIIILQQGKDFTGKSINLFVSKDNDKVFNTETIDYYNWFEITKPVEDNSVIAWYDLNLTTIGIEQMKLFGLNSRFPAIIANKSSIKKSYYFAGDFCDYKEPKKIYSFLGAANLYRIFSINNKGDSSHFYWDFYVPFMSKVLKEIKPLDKSVTFKAKTEVSKDGIQLVSKAYDKYFSVYQNGIWNDMYVKGIDIGTTLPGIQEGSFPVDNTIYTEWLEKIGNINANCIRVYTLMPCGFYRALDIYNATNPDKKLYLFQGISINTDPSGENFFDKDYNNTLKKATEDTINAIHGNASIKISDEQDSNLYINDVSGYLLGYLADPKLNPVNVAATDTANYLYKYNGDYIYSEVNSTPTEAWLASVCNKIYEYEQKNYNMQHPVAIISIPELDTIHHDKSEFSNKDDIVSININNINCSTKVKCGFFGAYNIFPDHPSFITGKIDEVKDEYAGYKQYLNDFMKTQKKYPVLISGFGLSTSMGLSEIAAVGYKDGKNNETKQGQGIISIMKIIKESGCVGGLIYEWNDEWGKSSEVTASLMIPYKRSNLWHNKVEPAQNYGILALEAPTPKDYAMTIKGNDPLESIAYTTNEAYLYIKANFRKLPDFNHKSIMIYLDTVDRKNGEYMLAPNINENWSGAEYNINIENENKADLLVIPTYNASKGSYFTAVSTSGIFEKILRQLSIANKTRLGKNISAKYEDGSTLVPGSFDEGINNFYFEGNTIYIRIPWARLNFTDPSSLLVLDDDKNKGIFKNTKDTLRVRMTDGIVASLIVMDKTTKNIDYHFPESVTASGYRTFSWSTWNVPNYVSRNKKSYDIIKDFFAE